MTEMSAAQGATEQGKFCSVWEDDGPDFYGMEFGELSLPKLQLKNPPQQEYIIYKTPEEFTVIQADTALEAITQSQIEVPYKILHPGNRLACIIEYAKLQRTKAEAVEQAQSAEATPETASEQAAQPAPQAQASAAEADKA